jgi:hypothetical protein
MRSRLSLIAALTGACLSTGCVIAPLPPPPNGPIYRGGYVETAPLPPDDIFVPDVIIIEGGIRHDRYFYQRHPEIYRRDRMMYPNRFRVTPPPRPDYRRPDYRRPSNPRPDYQRPSKPRPDNQQPGDQRPDDRRKDDHRKDDHHKKKPNPDQPDGPVQP